MLPAAVTRTSSGGVVVCYVVLGPDLQNILPQSYDYLTIMPKLRATYDERLILQNILRRAQDFS